MIEQRSERVLRKVKDGYVIIGGDAHFWPGRVSTAWQAFVDTVSTYEPKLVILNGDVIDGASISRHARIGWENRPTVKEEIEEAQNRLKELERVIPNTTEGIWNLGNHDSRFESKIANLAPEYGEVFGIHLKDHFPAWTPSWSVQINDDVIVKHRLKGGIHAAFNNVRESGMTIITNHLHSQNVIAYTDYRGTRYGVDTGMLADPRGPQFTNYTEDNPLNWRSGFALLQFDTKGVLLPPTLATVHDERKRAYTIFGNIYFTEEGRKNALHRKKAAKTNRRRNAAKYKG